MMRIPWGVGVGMISRMKCTPLPGALSRINSVYVEVDVERVK